MSTSQTTGDHASHEAVIGHLREMAEHLGRDAGDTMSKTAAALARTAADLVEQTKKHAGPTLEKAGKEIKEHPVTTAALVAASVGLISYALSRGRPSH